MSKAYTWEQVDKLAAQWHALPEAGNEAARKSLETQLFTAIFSLVSGAGGAANKRVDALGEFWLKDWPKFDPALSPISYYVKRRLGLRSADMRDADLGMRKRKVDGEERRIANSSLDALVDGDGSDGTRPFDIPDAHGEEAFGDIALDERGYECLALMLNLPARLRGRANNPEKINYYRLFFTDGAVRYIREEQGTAFFAHERELLDAMKLPFMDFFLVRQCRSIHSIFESPKKPYGELVEGRPMEPVAQPLPQDAYGSYLARVEGRRVGASAISQQQTAYRDFLREALC